ncbi:MAG: hypothetical protein GSR86_07575 [Desulfurococcales archaeon]|nr:hypothetical protein [Desulfurococcales archaeon]
MGRILEPVIAVLDEAAIIILLAAIGVYALYNAEMITAAEALALLGGIAGLVVFILYKVVEAHGRRVAVGREALVGKRGVVVEDLNPEGMIMIEGELWRAATRGKPIPKGSRVKVIGFENLTLIVEVDED